MYLKLRKCNFETKNSRRTWHFIPAQEVNIGSSSQSCGAPSVIVYLPAKNYWIRDISMHDTYVLREIRELCIYLQCYVYIYFGDL